MKTAPLIIAIGGAKGGVGKSMVCSNLAVQFAQNGLKTILLDLDLGAANQHTLFGISQSNKGWTEWLVHPESNLSDFLIQTKLEHLSLLAASGYILDVTEVTVDKQQLLIQKLKEMDADIILLDLGAGSHRSTLNFFAMAEIRLLVTTTEPISLLNNFEFLKNLIYHLFCKACLNYPEILRFIHEFRASSSQKISHLLDKIKSCEPFFAETLEDLVEDLEVFIIFNQVKKVDEVHLVKRLKKIVKNHLNLELKYPGVVFFSEEINASMQKTLPISMVSPQSVVTQMFKRISQVLLKQSLEDKEECSVDLIDWGKLHQQFYKNRVERKKAHHML